MDFYIKIKYSEYLYLSTEHIILVGTCAALTPQPHVFSLVLCAHCQ